MALFATMAVSVTFASYTGTNSITAGSSTSLATVTTSAVTLNVVTGETATKSLGTIFTISSVAPAYDNKIRLNVYLLNPDALKNYYSYFIVNLKVQEDSSAATDNTFSDISGMSGYLNLDKGVIEFVPGVDLSAGTNSANADYRVTATVTYHNMQTTGIVAPQFYLDVAQ